MKEDIIVLDLFDYYEPRNRLGYKSILSTFISNHDFWYKNKDSFELMPIDYINGYDRNKLVQAFIEECEKSYNSSVHRRYVPVRSVDREEIQEHIKQYIDFVIPKHYFVLLREQELGSYIDRSEYRNNYKGIGCVPDMKFVFEENYSRESIKFNTKTERILLNKEFSSLNYPYQKFSNIVLYRMVLQDAKIAGYSLIKEKDELSRLDLLKLLHYFYKDKPIDNLSQYAKPVENDNAKITVNRNGRSKNMSRRSKDNLLERGIAKLYSKYTELYDMYDEEVDLVIGMRYGHDGIQPCHSGCKGVCESSSGDSLCGGFMGCESINVGGTKLFIVMCSFGAQCKCHK